MIFGGFDLLGSSPQEIEKHGGIFCRNKNGRKHSYKAAKQEKTSKYIRGHIQYLNTFKYSCSFYFLGPTWLVVSHKVKQI